MSVPYSETTTRSWGNRIAGAFAGIIIGFILFIGSFVLLWWNEGRSVDRIHTIAEGRSAVIAVSADEILPDNEGKLVHLSGTADTDEGVEDDIFGIYEPALSLHRTVEMYQWKEKTDSETTTNLGGSETTKTTYHYNKDWSEQLIDSSDFKQQAGHENPASMPYESERYTAEDIYIGEFYLNDSFTGQLSDRKDYSISTQQYTDMDEDIRSAFTLEKGSLFSGDSAAPEVGDLRISYQIVEPATVSVIGKQQENLLTTYKTKDGTLELLEYGTKDAATMLDTAASDNRIITWLVRLGGALMMWAGLALVLRPLKVLGDVVPFIGSVLGAGVGLVTLVVTLPLSVITIALAWLAYRPLIGGALLAAALLVIIGGWRAIRQKKAAEQHS